MFLKHTSACGELIGEGTKEIQIVHILLGFKYVAAIELTELCGWMGTIPPVQGGTGLSLPSPPPKAQVFGFGLTLSHL